MKCERCNKLLVNGDGHAEILFLDEQGQPNGEKMCFCRGRHANEAVDYVRKLAIKHNKPLVEIDPRQQSEPRG